VQSKRIVSVVVAPILSQLRQAARGAHAFSTGVFALGLVNLMAVGGPPTQTSLAPQTPPLIASAALTTPANLAKPVPAATEGTKLEAPKAAPVSTPPTPAPASAADAPKPVPATVPAATPPASPAPAPAAPAPVSATPVATVAPAAPKAPVPAPSEMDRLRRAAAMMVQVNNELGVPQSPYGQIIYDIAIRHSINPHLVAALIHVESAFNARAVSPAGARGLMQLLPETARRFGLSKKKDLFDPKKNLEAGVRYLQWLANRFGGDAEKILAAYNAGEGAVERFGGVPPYQETQSYVQKIFGLLGFASVPPPAPLPERVESSLSAAASR
jgi:soluble lytic murein transglycosylase-like protein